MPGSDFNKPWWSGKDVEPDLAEKLLAPRGNAPLTPRDWADAAKELDLVSVPQPALPGLMVAGKTAVQRDLELTRRWREAAQVIANAREGTQVLNTTRSLGGFRDR